MLNLSYCRQAVGVPPLRGRQPRRATAATGTRTPGNTALMDLDLDNQGQTSQRPLNRSGPGNSAPHLSNPMSISLLRHVGYYIE
jgi:hypothetical protein